jgi:hypothetical protein
MQDFILLMHRDTTGTPDSGMWAAYFASLRRRGVFDGGSEIGAGETFRKSGAPGPLNAHIAGYIRLRATDLTQAREYLAGNPLFECGGTVEIREAPRD